MLRLWSNSPIFRRGAVIFAIPVISITPAIASVIWLQQAKDEANWWIDRTEEVIQESNILLRVLIDAETGIRGYALTKELEFLNPYKNATQEIPNCLSKLAKLIEDNPKQQKQLQQIDRQIIVKLTTLKQIFQTITVQTEIDSSPQLTKLFARNKTQMDAIRQSVDAFKDEEWRLLATRKERLDNINVISELLLGIAIVLGLLGYWIAIQFYYKSETKLEQRASELEQLNSELAKTNQLVQTRNQELNQFSYIVSHDLKAPLRAIANLSQWLEEDLEDKLDEDTRGQINLLRSRVQRMEGFINGLLEYSRAGRTEGAQK